MEQEGVEVARYWHAGVKLENGDFRWSHHTRRTRQAAILEARKMARQQGGSGLVEFWDSRHGLAPGDGNVIEGGFFVEEK